MSPAGNRPTDPVEDTSVSQASGQTGNPRGSRTSSLSGMDSGGFLSGVMGQHPKIVSRISPQPGQRRLPRRAQGLGLLSVPERILGDAPAPAAPGRHAPDRPLSCNLLLVFVTRSSLDGRSFRRAGHVECVSPDRFPRGACLLVAAPRRWWSWAYGLAPFRRWRCCLALVVSACSGADSGGGQPASSSSSPVTTSTAFRGDRVDAELGVAVEQWFARSYARGLRDVRAVLVLVDGRPVLERYRGGLPEDSYDTFSVGKSIVSSPVGIAIAEGKLRGVDVTLAEALPQYRTVIRPEVARTTLRQLLTMTAGLREDPPSGEPLAATLHGDWVSDILQHGFDHAPGTWVYSSIGSHLLAAVLVRATGMRVLRVRPRPTVRSRRDHDAAGRSAPSARRPQGRARLRRRQVRLAHRPPGHQRRARPHQAHRARPGCVRTAHARQGGLERPTAAARGLGDRSHPRRHVDAYAGNRYGYQWWIPDAGDHPAFAAVGFGGQLLEVVPDLRLVVVAVTEPRELEAIDTSGLEFLVKLAVIPHVHATST